MITVTGQLTFADFQRARRTHRWRYDLTFALVLLAMAALLVLVAQDYIFPTVLVVYVVVVRPLWLRSRWKAIWRRTPSFHQGRLTYCLDETGFHSEDDEGRPSVIHWDKFIKFKESIHTFLLYLGPHLYVFLPKRWIGPDDQEAIRVLAMERIGNRKTAVGGPVRRMSSEDG